MLHFPRFTIISTLLVFGFFVETFAQTDSNLFSARNSIYLELGGSSGRYAVNYGRIIHQNDKLKLNVSGGFALWHYTANFGPKRTTWLPAVPIEFTIFWGRLYHHLEIGVGITPLLQTVEQLDPVTRQASEEIVFGSILPLRLGYRYQKPSGGFFYRVGYTPFFKPPLTTGDDLSFQPWFAGVSIGKSF